MRAFPLALLVVIGAPTSRAAERPVSSEPRTISTSGDAEIRVAPDEVAIRLGVESFNKDLGKAKKEADERIQRIIAAVRGAGAEEKRIATDEISIEPHYDSSSYSGGRVNDGYVVRRGLQLTLRDISRFDAVLSAAVEAGANVVHGIQFSTTELRRHRDKARELAMKAAEEKAVLLAKTMGMKPGKPRSISEIGGGWYSGYGAFGWGARGGWAQQNVSQNAGPSTAVEGTVAPGQIRVTAGVQVVFDLE
jgi:hypothetical protein